MEVSRGKHIPYSLRGRGGSPPSFRPNNPKLKDKFIQIQRKCSVKQLTSKFKRMSIVLEFKLLLEQNGGFRFWKSISFAW